MKTFNRCQHEVDGLEDGSYFVCDTCGYVTNSIEKHIVFSEGSHYAVCDDCY